MCSKEISSVFITRYHEPLDLPQQNVERSYTDILGLAKEKGRGADTLLERLVWSLENTRHLPKISVLLPWGPTTAPEDM